MPRRAPRSAPCGSPPRRRNPCRASPRPCADPSRGTPPVRPRCCRHRARGSAMIGAMRIAVIGGTGTLGRAVVRALGGHDVIVLGRSTTPAIDLRDGAGLDEALQGVDVVVDASNGPPGGKAS